MPSQNPGVFRYLAEDYGVSFHEVDLHAGECIPDLHEFDALWIMGGSMQVWEEEEYPWLVDEKQVVRDVVYKHKIPFLGICFGHQLLADALGGQAGLSSENELGLFEITPTEAGKNHPLLQGLPSNPGWTNVHTAEVILPPGGAIILARSTRCENHIMQVNDITYSCQFHPEVCDHSLKYWLEIPGIEPFLEDELGEEGFKKFKSDITDNLPSLNRGATRLFENWLNIVF